MLMLLVDRVEKAREFSGLLCLAHQRGKQGKGKSNILYPAPSLPGGFHRSSEFWSTVVAWTMIGISPCLSHIYIYIYNFFLGGGCKLAIFCLGFGLAKCG